jgi:hypothetical protein
MHSFMDADLEYGDRLQHIVRLLEPRVQRLADRRRQEEDRQQQREHDGDAPTAIPFPAVDFASGHGYYPLAYAQHFAGQLEWYPTEYNGGAPNDVHREGSLGDYLLSTLSWLKVEAAAGTGRRRIFSDSRDKALRVDDMVRLTGLSNAAYNGTYGVVQGPDPNCEGRVSVRCIQRSVPMSFKPSNLARVAVPPGRPARDASRYASADPGAIQGLIDRARLVDLLEPSTWSNVSSLYGRCAVVTCTSLLTCLGYREPNIWRDCLRLASRLLAPGACFLQYDTAKYGRFGHGRTMKRFVEDNDLGLVLEGRKEEASTSHGTMYILIWRKEPALARSP